MAVDYKKRIKLEQSFLEGSLKLLDGLKPSGWYATKDGPLVGDGVYLESDAVRRKPKNSIHSTFINGKLLLVATLSAFSFSAA